MDTRVPLHNSDAEASVLGAILHDNEHYYKAEEMLTSEDFYNTKNKLIFEAMVLMKEKGEVIDLVTIASFLKNQKTFDEIGGVDYLASLINAAPMASNHASYCKIVKDMAQLRKMVQIANEITDSCYGEYESVDNLIEEAERKIFSIGQGNIKGDFTAASVIVSETLDSIQKRIENKGKLTGLETGFKVLDRYTAGLQKSDLIYVAARPSMGKTAFALNIAGNIALREGGNVAIFSLEMSKSQLMQRLICSEACIDLEKVRKGDISDDEWKSITHAASKLYNSGIFIDDTGSATISDVRAKTRRLKAEYGLDLVLIDYLQLMTSNKNSESRQVGISEISRGLKALARELDCPIMCLSQLSRAPDARTDHHPLLADLRESGSIEQDADVVMFLYREHYYTPEDEDNVYDAELIVSKQRNGPTGTIDLMWRPEWTRFTSCEK